MEDLRGWPDNRPYIRRYIPTDRESVRRICCETANLGRPIENIFRDRRVLADLLTRYYTDWTARFCWVAEAGGRVIGYLSGCLNTRHFFWVMAVRIAPLILLESLLRGSFFSRQGRHLLSLGTKSLIMGGFFRRIPLNEYPAHLHIDILPEFRRKQIGRQLIEKFFDQCRAAGIPGVHLSTRDDNKGGRDFFISMGFKQHNSYPMAFPLGGGSRRGYAVIYVKKLS